MNQNQNPPIKPPGAPTPVLKWMAAGRSRFRGGDRRPAGASAAFVAAALQLAGAGVVLAQETPADAKLTNREIEHPALQNPGWSKRPGRLVGWGMVAEGKSFEEVLPIGPDAEGFIAVAAGPHQALALHENGAVYRAHVNDGWSVFQAFEKKVTHMSIEAGSYLFVFEDGGVLLFQDPIATPNLDAALPDDLGRVKFASLGQGMGIALKSDGTSVYWNPDKPEAFTTRMTGSFPHPLRWVSGCGHSIGGIADDGTGFFNTSEKGEAIEIVGTGSPAVVQASLGYKHGLFLFENGSIKAAGTGTYEQTKIPDFGEGRKVVEVRAGPRVSLARLDDGSWVKWGEDRNGETDLEKIRKLWEFALGGGYDPGYAVDSGFVVGIAPSYVDSFFTEHIRHSELKAALDGFQAVRDTAAKALAEFEERYTGELEKLKAAAAKNNRPKIAVLIEDELANFRDHSRPAIEQPEVVARLQRIYREQAPALETEKQAAILAVYEKAVSGLKTLQDELTQAKKLQAAVETRTEREHVITALEYLKNPPEKAVRAPEEPPMPPVAEKDRIFSLNDPATPGDVFFLGTIRGAEIPLPPSNDRKEIVSVAAGLRSWIAIQANGSFTCDSPEDHLTAKMIPGGIRKLKAAAAGMGYAAVTADGELVHWGWPGSYEAEKLLPPAGVENVTTVAVSKRNKDGLCGAALRNDGTVRVWGEPFDRERFSWKRPEGLKDAIQVAAINEGLGFLKKDGTVLMISVKGHKTISIPDTEIVLLKGSGEGGYFAFVTNDERLGLISYEGKVTMENMSSVVDVVVGSGDYLALRADGTWVARSESAQEIMEKWLKDLNGVRHLDLGGTKEERFLIGIRPPEK